MAKRICWGSRFEGFRMGVSGLRVSGFGFQVSGFRFGVSGLGFRVLGLGGFKGSGLRGCGRDEEVG